MIIAPVTIRPAATIHGAASVSASSAATVPKTATNAQVRTPALAVRLRWRSSPIRNPIARLVASGTQACRPCE